MTITPAKESGKSKEERIANGVWKPTTYIEVIFFIFQQEKVNF